MTIRIYQIALLGISNQSDIIATVANPDVALAYLKAVHKPARIAFIDTVIIKMWKYYGLPVEYMLTPIDLITAKDVL